MADFRVSDNELVNFDSHKADNNYEVYKDYENQITAKWVEVKYLKAGDEIAIPDYETGKITWAKIISIKILEPQQVYDLAIEGTHNFIANDIVAHNTFVTGFVNFTNNTAFNQTLYLVNGNVGIGTTDPAAKLQIDTNDADAPAAGTGGGASIELRNQNTGTSIATGIVALDASSVQQLDGLFFLQTGQTVGDETAAMTFWTSNSGDSGAGERMRIDPSGNVGIGTTSPGRLLEVSGSINGTQLNISGPVNLAYGTGNLGIGTTGHASLSTV